MPKVYATHGAEFVLGLGEWKNPIPPRTFPGEDREAQAITFGRKATAFKFRLLLLRTTSAPEITDNPLLQFKFDFDACKLASVNNYRLNPFVLIA